MRSSVCVLVTVPTEEEERRLSPSLCTCGYCYKHRDFLHSRASKSTGSDKLNSQDDLCSKEQAHWRCGCSKRILNMGLEENISLEKALRATVKQLSLDEATFWSKDLEGRKLQACFNMFLDERYECLISMLQDWGIGKRLGTHIASMICLDTHRYEPHGPSASVSENTWERFMDSVRSRLNVNQVVRQVSREATITFDFIVLLIAATLLSCVGLVENSVMFMSSCMLISPLMGPIIAGIFGTVIGDASLRWLGIRNELIGIAIAMVIGFIFGGLVCCMSHFFAISGGLTEEMLTRCNTHSLLIGIFTALASGAAGAIAILGGNIGSLVGVAISASLLPPAVNSGLLGALALGTRFMDPKNQLLQNLIQHTQYSPHLHVELFVSASISMGLTLLNIICVWIMGVLVLRMKELAPAVRRNQEFWHHDVKTVRECAANDPALQYAIKALASKQHGQLDVEAPQYQNTWSPGVHRSLDLQQNPSHMTLPGNNFYHTVHGFHKFCSTLHEMGKTPAEKDLQVAISPLEYQLKMRSSAARCTSEPISVMELFSKGRKGSSCSTLAASQTSDLTRELGLRPYSSNSNSIADVEAKQLWVQSKEGLRDNQVGLNSSSSDKLVCNDDRSSVRWKITKIEESTVETMPTKPAVANIGETSWPRSSHCNMNQLSGQLVLPGPSVLDRPLQLMASRPPNDHSYDVNGDASSTEEFAA